MSDEPAVKRVPVDFDYQGLNWTFLKWMAKIVKYADEKYGSWSQYTKGELTGNRSPMNHIIEHWRSYLAGEPYDHFDGDPRWHLAGIAYNAMMQFFQHTRWGFKIHPLVKAEREGLMPSNEAIRDQVPGPPESPRPPKHRPVA